MSKLSELRAEYDAAYKAHQEYPHYRDGPAYVKIWKREDAALNALEEYKYDYETRLAAAQMAVAEASKVYLKCSRRQHGRIGVHEVIKARIDWERALYALELIEKEVGNE